MNELILKNAQLVLGDEVVSGHVSVRDGLIADISAGEIIRRGGIYFAWLFFLLGLTIVIGLLPGIFVFLVLYLRFQAAETWAKTMAISIGLWVPIYILFHRLLFIPWPQSLLGDWFPALRSIAWISLF